MATISMTASLRDRRGKGAARKLRATGQVPAVVYTAGAAATALSIDPHALEVGFTSSKNPNTLVALEFADGSSRTCIVKDVQRHPVSQAIEHVDFYEVDPSVELVFSVPFTTSGRAAGTRVGGQLAVHIRRVDVRCKPSDIPATVNADVTPLEIGQSLKISQLEAPAGCTYVYRRDYAVVEVQGKREEAAPGKGA